ncbi:MAG: hypothetical protein FJ311_07470 [Rhodospirillales bacterium]|nr:hypothetical protein [Rhodospirillales bacterium]
MANEEHLKLARQGKDAWNKWRKENPKEPADFSGTDFTLPENKNISFAEFEFGGGANFNRVTFGDLPREWKSGQETNGGAMFNGATFGDEARFEDACFGRYANFEGVTFGNEARFDLAKFDHGASFDRTGFGRETRFDGVIFTGIAGFNGTKFELPPCFASVKGSENLGFVDTQFWSKERTLRSTSDHRIVTNLRHLRDIANKIHAPDIERDLFIMERQAECGVLWNGRRSGESGSCLFGWLRLGAAMFLFSAYRALSNCGRSAALPALWFVAMNFIVFFSLYWWIADKPNFDSVLAITLVNLLPIGTFAKPAAETAGIDLFAYGVVPWGAHVTAIFQGVVNALLVFLLALALRNHFKVK